MIVARVALRLAEGVVPAGEPAVVVAASAARRRDAADAAAHCSGEIKDKLAASIAPLCLGSEPKAAAALAAVAAAARTILVAARAETIGALAVEAMVEAMTANDREKMLASRRLGRGDGRRAREMETAEKAAEAAAKPGRRRCSASRTAVADGRRRRRAGRARPRSRFPATTLTPRTKRTPWTWTASRGAQGSRQRPPTRTTAAEKP